MARTKSNPKAAARRKAPIARSRTGSSGSAESETLSNSVNAGRTRGTKQNLIIGLLQRAEGTSLGQLVEATGWLPHTTRAALTRLRQGGHELQKEKRKAGETAYRIAPARTTRSRKAA
jgi:hypothetical protein